VSLVAQDNLAEILNAGVPIPDVPPAPAADPNANADTINQILAALRTAGIIASPP
jgi:hypothetical protein